MATNTKNRSELKSYFVKNAIPTQEQFADLIDGQLNQAEDGVFKASGEPLSVVAGSGAQKRALRLYTDYPAANPEWLISLNPAQDPAKPDTVRPGFGVTDGAGNTRLFIDKATGNVGIGTNQPKAALDVRGDVNIGAYLTVGNKGDNSIVNFIAADNKTAQIGVQNNDDQGFYVLTDHTYRLSVNQNGNVGIGTNLASEKLEIVGNLKITDGNLIIDDCNIEPRSSSIHIQQEDWQAPTLLNKWVNYSNEYNQAGYFKDSCGIVHLRGLVKNGAQGTEIFTLPEGYRPAARQLHVVCTNSNVSGRVDVRADGRVTVVAGSSAWLSLDDISFRAA